MGKLDINEINKQIQLLRKELGKVEQSDFGAGQIAKANEELVKLRGEVQDVNNDLSSLSDSFKGSVEELTKANYSLGLAKKSFKGLVSIADQFNQINLNGTEIDSKKIDKLKAQGDQHFKNLTYAKQYGNLSKAETSEIEGQLARQKEFNQSLDEAVKFQERLSSSSGVKSFGFLADISSAIPGMSKLTPMFENASKAAKETQFAMEKQRELDLEALKTGKGLTREAVSRLGLENEITDFTSKGTANQSSLSKVKTKAKGIDKKGANVDLNSKISKKTAKVPKGMSAMMSGIKSLGPALTKALGPIGILLEIAKGLMAADKQATELQKTMMLTKSEANSFNANLQGAARASGNMAVTGTKVFETFMSLTKEAGFVTNYSMETLGTATKLQAVLGISASSTSNLAKAAAATGTSLEANYKSVLGSSYEMQQQAGTQLDMKAILEATGQVSGQIRANMGGNVENIAKAVTQAKLLGTNLETVAAAGKKMLNFEESIANEMEAELLTGKQLNLDRARAAALAGDQETVAKELAKNMGDFTEFSKMNVIQQDALAAAMGMTSDQVADMLFDQQVMGRTAKELREQGEGELATKLEAKSAQDQMNASMEQLKETFVQLGSALLPIMEVVSFFAGVLGMIVGYTQDLIGFLNPFGDAFLKSDPENSAGNKAAQGIGKNSLFQSDVKTKEEKEKEKKSVNDAVIDTGGSIITTNPADYLIATQDPGGLASAVGGGSGGGEAVAILKELLAAVKQGGDVILDGNKVGRNLSIASSGIG